MSDASTLSHELFDARRSITDRVDDCEYDPDLRQAKVSDKYHRVPATVIVGADGQWRLCDACAALPVFRRFKNRQPIPHHSPNCKVKARPDCKCLER
jgi:hypothetical protein